MKDITKKYTNGEVTVVWKPGICIHSRNCFNGLPQVFDPSRRPWITPEKESTEKIVAQIKKCPSGALSYIMNNEDDATENEKPTEVVVEPSPNGPLMVHGDIMVKDAKGSTMKKGKVTAFCRCGASQNKPFCDGSHRKVEFVG
jgi:uncharacterized Fe-S cluster protein YjdI